ncbi:hypothetical protein WME97_22015 [Sorangium sp. So ce367]
MWSVKGSTSKGTGRVVSGSPEARTMRAGGSAPSWRSRRRS